MVIDRTGCAPSTPSRPSRPAQCVFEHVYFARPDSLVFGRNVLGRRGCAWAASSRASARPTPTSWCRCPTAAWAPPSATRRRAGSLPVGPHPQPLRGAHLHRAQAVDPLLRREDQAQPGARASSTGKRVVLIDDSHRARHHLAQDRAAWCREAGAREVHLRISSPPTTGPCYYGIDTPRRSELIASEHTVDEIRALHRRRQPRLPEPRRHAARAVGEPEDDEPLHGVLDRRASRGRPASRTSGQLRLFEKVRR